MKITKNYLKQVIKEELEKTVEEGAGEFFTKARQKVFGLNAQEKLTKQAEDWFETGDGSKLINYLKKEAQKGTFYFDASKGKGEQGILGTGEWARFFPKTNDSSLKSELKKVFNEKLKELKMQNSKNMEKNSQTAIAKEKSRYADKFLDPRKMDYDERNCLERAIGISVKDPSFDEEYAKVKKQINDMAMNGNYGNGVAHPADISFQQCQGAGSTGLSGKLQPYTGKARKR